MYCDVDSSHIFNFILDSKIKNSMIGMIFIKY